MSNVLPPIGRAGLRNAVRKLTTSMIITGWRDVDPEAQFISGMVATLAEVDGKPKVQVADNGKVPVGLFFCHKTVDFYEPLVAFKATFGEWEGNPNSVRTMPYLKTGSVRVTDLDGNPYTATTDYTVDLTSGVITRVFDEEGEGEDDAIGEDETVLVYARYRHPDLTGIDQTLGSGKVALLEGNGEIATLVYDTTVSYALGDDVKFNNDGVLCTGGGNAVVGKVTKVPTSDNSELHVKVTL